MPTGRPARILGPVGLKDWHTRHGMRDPLRDTLVRLFTTYGARVALVAAISAAGIAGAGTAGAGTSVSAPGQGCTNPSDTVMAIRAATSKPERVIKVGVGAFPDAIAITPNGKTAYVALLGDDEVLPIRTATNKPGKLIKVGSAPTDLVVTPNGKTVYVANWASDTVTPISTATNKPGKAIKVDVSAGVIGITPNGKTAYAADGYIVMHPSPTPINAVIPIRTATNTVGRTILAAPPGAAVDAFAFTRDSTTAYAAVGGASQVDPIRVATGTLGKAIPAGASPGTIVITPNGRTGYVEDYDAPAVAWFSTVTNKPGKTITVGAALSPYAGTVAIAVTPNGKTLYVGTESYLPGVDDWVTPVPTATNKPGKPITVGQSIAGIVITPNGTTAYVANENGVTPIRVATNTAGKTIGAGTGLAPVTMAVTPNGQTVYAANVSTCTPAVPPGTADPCAAAPARRLDVIGTARPRCTSRLLPAH
jgi:YVTN family beta-propeller protein